jgi:hypothetical protein
MACSQKNRQEPPGIDTEELPSAPAPEEVFDSDRQIALVFGYGYNDSIFVSETKAKIESVFGLAENGGLVLPLVFPDDFAGERISLLYDKLAGYDMCGLIVIGAPERTHAVLARLQDSWGEEIPAYPVIMLAPQDDVLGIEAGADAVLDFVVESESDPLDEQPATAEAEMPEIVFALIRYLYKTKDAFVPPIAHDVAALFTPTEAGFALNGVWEIAPYRDPETRLAAINHFILGKGKIEQ